MAVTETSLTVVALALTGWSRLAGDQVAADQRVAVTDGTTAHQDTPGKVVAAPRQLNVLPWAIPAVTGALVVISAFAGEQQQLANVAGGLVRRVTG